LEQFELRKRQHIDVALTERVQDKTRSDFYLVRIKHEALPELNLNDVALTRLILGRERRTPFVVSSMTAGHAEGRSLNLNLAQAAAQRGWLMGVGSQRRELTDPAAALEWKSLREAAPSAALLGNLGLVQLIEHSVDEVLRLLEALAPEALIVHLNSLQEALQSEGEPYFSGGLNAIETLCKRSPVPIIVKETGAGIRAGAARRLVDVGVRVIDVSGAGGTHWGLVEGARADTHGDTLRARAAEAFVGWGLGTCQSVFEVTSAVSEARDETVEVWGSGGVRTGVEAFKLLCLGARAVGLAQPLLVAAKNGPEALDKMMAQIEFETRVAMFCSGQRTLEHGQVLQTVWEWA
jgi:isopentenyl-diphosphate Delta-isomerase